MLIEFALSNYRSFASEQRLNMSAGRFHSPRIGAVINSGARTCPNILRCAAILGANGSGKSSFVLGMNFLQSFIATSAQSTQIGDRIPVQRNRLDSDHRDDPSTFEISFFYKETEFTYRLAVDQKVVHEESLHSRANGKPLIELFSRKLNNGATSWNIGNLPGDQGELWKKSTRQNASFLSTAVQLNSEALAIPFEWLTRKLRILTSKEDFPAAHTAHLIVDHIDDGCRDEVLDLIRESDLGIRDVSVEERKFDVDLLPDEMPDDVRKAMLEDLKDQTFYKTRFTHRDSIGKDIILELEDESDGTQKIYEMAGAWVSSLRHGYTLVVDELETSLHPYIVRMLVQMFQNPRTSDSTSQLIFTSHSDSLLDAQILERDQFWFVEKRAKYRSEMIPLIDYRPRKDEALRRNYLRGAYGGVPVLPHVKRV